MEDAGAGAEEVAGEGLLDLYAPAEPEVPPARDSQPGGDLLDLYDGVAPPPPSPEVRPSAAPDELPAWVQGVWRGFRREIRERYRPMAVLGQGGMGVVVEAFDREMDRVVAIKGLRDPEAALPSLRARQAREAQLAARLTHPNILPAYDRWRDRQGYPWYSMLRVAGEAPTLARRLADLAHLRRVEDRPLGELLDVFQQVCRAAAHAHDQGVVHRDIKPDNIFLGPSGEALLADWGVAGEARSEEPMVRVGTPGYASPEQLQADRPSPRADVYSLGVVLFELVVGRRPSDAATVSEGSAAPRPGPEDRPLEVPERVPRELAEIIRRATARDPEARYGSVREVLRALDAYTSGGLVEGLSYGLAERARKWARAHPALVAGLVTGVLGAVVLVSMAVRHNRLQAELLATAHRNLADSVAEKAASEFTARRWMRARALALKAAEVAGWARAPAPPAAAGILAGALGRPLEVWGQDLVSPGLALEEEAGAVEVLTRDGREVIARPAGVEARPLAGWSGGAVLAAAVAGPRRALAGLDATLVVLDPGATPRRLTPPGPLRSLAMDPHGRSLLAVLERGGLASWQLDAAPGSPATSSTPRVLAPPHFEARCAALAPPTTGGTRSLAAVGGADGTVRILDPATGIERASIRWPFSVARVAFGPGGRVIASAGDDRQLELWDARAWRPAGALEGLPSRVTSLSFSSDGQRLAVGGAGGEVTLWHVETRRLCLALDAHAGPVASLAFTADGEHLASSGDDGRVRVWRALGCPRPPGER